MLSNKKEKIFSRSIEEANKSDMLFKHGCVATYGGKIIASGYNINKGYIMNDNFIKNQCSCHAEICVLKKIYEKNRYKRHKLNRIMKKTTLYISRTASEKVSTNSAPCFKCLNMIKKYNIKKIIFHMDDEYHEYRAKDYYTSHTTFGDIYAENK